MNRTAWYSHFTKWAARITEHLVTFTLEVALIAAWTITERVNVYTQNYPPHGVGSERNFTSQQSGWYPQSPGQEYS
jgi:hypothetical protein